MKIFTGFLSNLRPVRFLIIAFTCALLFLSSVVPAFAISSPKSDPEDATTQLFGIQRETDAVDKEPPAGLKEVQKKSNEGLNEVQGAADIEKQKRPENSQGASSAKDDVENFLEKVTGKK